MRTLPLLLLTTICLAPACDEPAPPAQDQATAPAAPIERGPEYDSPLGQRLFDLWRRVAPHAHATSSLREGQLSPGRPAEAMVVLTGVRCYQILVVTAEPVEQLKLTLIDPTGVPQVHLRGEGDELALGQHEPICPGGPGSYRVRLESNTETAYALRVYGAMSM